MSTNYLELRELIDFLRENGVMSYTTPDVTLVLGEPPARPMPDLDKPSEVGQARPGRDGLTAAEQIELYGRKFDGE